MSSAKQRAPKTRLADNIVQIKRAISSWVHKFADTAEKALGTEFTRQGLQTHEERAVFVQKLLGNANDMSDKKRPFIWESAYDDYSAQHEVFLHLVVGCPTFVLRLTVTKLFPGDFPRPTCCTSILRAHTYHQYR